MNKKGILVKALIGTTLVLVYWLSPAFAVDIGGRFGINGNGGILSPVGELAGQPRTGFVFGGKILLGLNKFVMAEGNIGYSRLSSESDDVDNLSILELTGGLRFFMFAEGHFFPYLNGAVGLYQTTLERKTGESEEDSNLGGQLGLGFMVLFTDHVSLDVQGRFHYFPGKISEFEDLDDNAYVTFTGGISYLF